MGKLDAVRALREAEFEAGRKRRVAAAAEKPRFEVRWRSREQELLAQLAEQAGEIERLTKELAKRAVTSTVTSTKECPVCKARRDAATARQKKWRKTHGAES